MPWAPPVTITTLSRKNTGLIRGQVILLWKRE